MDCVIHARACTRASRLVAARRTPVVQGPTLDFRKSALSLALQPGWSSPEPRGNPIDRRRAPSRRSPGHRARPISLLLFGRFLRGWVGRVVELVGECGAEFRYPGRPRAGRTNLSRQPPRGWSVADVAAHSWTRSSAGSGLSRPCAPCSRPPSEPARPGARSSAGMAPRVSLIRRRCTDRGSPTCAGSSRPCIR